MGEEGQDVWDWLLVKDMDSSLVIQDCLALSVIPRLPRSILGRCDLIRSSQANERRPSSVRGRGTKGPLPRPCEFVGPRGERSDKLSVIASVLPNDVG